MMFERQQGYGEGDYRGGFGPIAHWVILAMLAIIAILLVKTCSRKRALRIQRRQ